MNETKTCNFMDAAPSVIHCGENGWEFIKHSVHIRRGTSPKKSDEDKKELAELKKLLKPFIVKYGKNSKAKYADPEFRKINSQIRSLQSKYYFKQSFHAVETFEYCGNGSRGAKSALTAYLKGLKVIWATAKKESKEPIECFNRLLDRVYRDCDMSIEEIGEKGSWSWRPQYSDPCDTYDFGEWTRA
jgi:hypothetical protein